MIGRLFFRRCVVPAVGLSALFVVVGCSKPIPDDPSVLAVFDGGDVRKEELDRAILALPPAERQTQIESSERLEAIVRRLAFRRVMKNRMLTDGVEDVRTLEFIRDSLVRHATVELYFRDVAPPKPITTADIDGWIEEHPELGTLPSRRLVYTCFKGFSDGRSRDATIAEMEAVRRRIEEGEPFPQVAERESESETRHRRGLLGWISPGDVAPGLERVLEGLGEGELSGPIVTKDGVHLFWVKTVIEARRRERSELRAPALPEIRREREEAAIDRALEELGVEVPPVPSREALAEKFRSGDPEAVVLEVGGRAFDLTELRVLLARDPTRASFPREFCRRLVRIEALRQAIEADGPVDPDRVADVVEAGLEQEELTLFVNERTRAWLAGQEERLRRFFDSDPARFRTLPRFHVLKLSVPLGEDPVRRMRELERFCARPGAGAADLAGAAERFGGRVEDLGSATLDRLVGRDPGILTAASLPAGGLTPPHREENALVIYGTLERTSPEDRTFDEARDDVVEVVLREDDSAVRAAFADEVLEGAGLKLFKERIADLDFGVIEAGGS